MPAEIILPQLGMMQTEAQLVSWLRQNGDHVEAGEAVAIIETDKADVEIESPVAGQLAAIGLEPGDSAAVGTVIAYVLGPGEEAPRTPREEASSPRPAPDAPSAPPQHGRQGSVADSRRDAVGVKASPGARRLAADLGIDLSSVAASGPEGRITEQDVRAAADRRGDSEAAPVSRARRVMAERMAESGSAPHLALETSVDASKLVAARGEGITITDLVLRAVAVTLHAHPELNATFQDGRVIQFDRVNIGLAVDTEEGLLVPVLADADSLDLADLSRQRASLVERARKGSLAAGDVVDATFTVTNLGVFDVDAAWPIINPPGVAILALGRVRDQPVAAEETVTVRPVIRLVLTADHRAVDGAQSARFLGALKDELEGVQ